ncbi:UNVERIFIED_CONTAM: hypothetical protein Sradi_5702900 [Sesamum radiatum]|uniref:Uncharacterized protein n=1 Tax=Sesamum radiatum TaxID=300843 RepID=A0AAW2L0W9_SESRA
MEDYGPIAGDKNGEEGGLNDEEESFDIEAIYVREDMEKENANKNNEDNYPLEEVHENEEGLYGENKSKNIDPLVNTEEETPSIPQQGGAKALFEAYFVMRSPIVIDDMDEKCLQQILFYAFRKNIRETPPLIMMMQRLLISLGEGILQETKLHLLYDADSKCIEVSFQPFSSR